MVEFFDIFYIVSLIPQYFEQVELYLWQGLVLSGGIFAVLYVLQSVGLFVLAGREKLPNRYLAFIPFFNCYLMGKLAGNCSLFGKKVKNAGIYYAVADLLVCVKSVFSIVIEYLLDGYYNTTAMRYENVPSELLWADTAHTVSLYVSPVLNLVYILFFVTVLFAFFRRYAVRSVWLFSIFSALLPVKGALIFAVRNNAPFDYESYAEAQRQAYNAYRQGGDPFGGHYQNPYGQNPYGQNPTKKEDDPFAPYFGEGNDGERKDGNDDIFGL